MKTKILLLLIPCLCVCAQAHAQNEFGRFYTTPRQRLQLDELKNQRPQEEIVVNIDAQDFDEPVAEEEAVTLMNSIIVNGLVYRSDGKNTAWVNSNSTIAGSIENQYTRVNEKDIHTNAVQITLPDKHSSIELKVGQQYDVLSQQVYDVGQQPVNVGPLEVPDALVPTP